MWLGYAEVRTVILINLLPHREIKRQERKRAFMSALGLSAVIGIVMVVIWFAILQQMTGSQEQRNDMLKQEIHKLDVKISEIASLRDEIDALKARQFAVESLQTDRNVPIYLLNELVSKTPDGVYLTSIKQGDSSVAITGMAQTNERVSEFLRNTAYASTWLEHPDLIEIKSATQGQGRDLVRLSNFSLRVTIKRPQSPSEAASAAKGQASSPQGAASVAKPSR
jgi:type IV pilus assembly protein PilN